MPPVATLLGPVLKDNQGNDVPTTDALSGKVVALYFSASWCVLSLLHTSHGALVFFLTAALCGASCVGL